MHSLADCELDAIPLSGFDTVDNNMPVYGDTVFGMRFDVSRIDNDGSESYITLRRGDAPFSPSSSTLGSQSRTARTALALAF